MEQNKRRISWIARTAMCIALLIVFQAATAPLGNQLVTGTVVNLVLVVAAIASGLSSGLCVALISPVFAKLFGIGPLWAIIPFVALGNAALVLVWHLIGGGRFKNRLVGYLIALPVAAAAKYAVLYLGVVKLAVEILLKLPQPQAGVISQMFSLPQLFTALMGGAVAILVLIPLRKALKLP